MPAVSDTKYLVQAGWNDVPHLSEAMKKQMSEDGLPHLISPRSTGNPSLGAGAIYPLERRRLEVEPFDIPAYWPRGYGFDVGWNRTAAIWGALDRSADILYLYTEHYESHALPTVHAESINARGKWIPGFIDPASRISNLKDGDRLLDEYLATGLNLTKAINAVDAGLLVVWKRMYTGRLKVFSSCQNWFAEHALYRRDKDGKIVKDFDHLMDATRYLCISGVPYMKVATPQDYGLSNDSASQNPGIHSPAGY